MNQQWGPPPPPLGDPWGRAPSSGSGPLHQTVLGDPYGSGGTPHWQIPQPPPIWPTVLITALFGLFGLIPAASAANRARQQHQAPGRYWQAFGLTFGAVLLVQSVLLVAVVVPALNNWVLTGPRPTVSSVDDTFAPTRTPVAPAPVTTRSVPATTHAAPATTHAMPVTTQPATTIPAPPPVRTVSSLPSGSWITVLDSLAKTEHTEQAAQANADRLSGAAQVVVVDSDRIPGLNNGYWAISITGSNSRSQATDRCALLNRPVGGTCYPRQVG